MSRRHSITLGWTAFAAANTALSKVWAPAGVAIATTAAAANHIRLPINYPLKV